MSETPKSRMFGFAAALTWMKSRQGYAHVLTLLIAVTLCGLCTKNALAQVDPVLTGAFSAAERAAILRGVAYWNDLCIEINPDYSNTITFSPEGGGVEWNYAAYSVQLGVGNYWVTAPNTQLRARNPAEPNAPHMEVAALHGLGRVLGFHSGVLPNIDTTNWAQGTITPPYGNMSDNIMWWGNADMCRPFFSELELTIFRDDIGHDIDISRFFGLTIFEQSTGVIRLDDPDGYDLDGMYGVGIYLAVGNDNRTYTTNTPYPTYYPGSNNNTVILETDIITRGYAGAGVRVEGNNNNFTIAQGVTVAATGERAVEIVDGDTVIDTLVGNGVGVILTHGTGSVFNNYGWIDAGPGEEGIGGQNGIGLWINSNDTTVVNHNRINATGSNGIGVLITHYPLTSSGSTYANYTGSFLNRGRIDSGPGGTGIYIRNLEGENTSARLDNSGIINAGVGNNAIYIEGQGTIGTWTTLPVLHGINLMEGTEIVGNIHSSSSNWQVLTFGRLAGSDGFAVFDNVNNTYVSGGNSEDFEIRIRGEIVGIYDMETWGGTTVIEHNLDSPGGWLYIGRGNLTSTLVLRGNVDGLQHVTVLGSGTLVASGEATVEGSGTTISVSTYVDVRTGGVISPSVETNSLGRLTITRATTAFGYGSLFMMEGGTTLRVDLGPGEDPDFAGISNSDRITVIGANTLDPETGEILAYNTTIGVPVFDPFDPLNPNPVRGITIDLTTLYSGTFRLISAATPGTLLYTDENIAATSVVSNGLSITSDFGRKAVSEFSVSNVDNTHLELFVGDIVETGNQANYRLTWTGLVDGTTWDARDPANPITQPGTENWRDESAYGVWFEDGDAVTFGLRNPEEDVPNTISIFTGGVEVGEMLIVGEGDWIFNGNIIGMIADITDITDGTTTPSSGSFIMEGTGTVILNGVNAFMGDILLDGGERVIDEFFYSNTVVDGDSHALATAGNIYIGTTGYATLNLLNGGNAGAANNVYVGGTLIQGGRGILSGSGNVQANTILINETGALYAGGTPYDFGTLNIFGNLQMVDGSTLMADLGAGNQSNMVDVQGSANLGAININLTRLFEDYELLVGNYTLLTANGLFCDDPDAITVLLNGEEIPYLGRWRWINITADVDTSDNSVSLSIGGEEKNVHLHWTGEDIYNPNLWDLVSENWEGYAESGERIVHFMPGDALTFGLNGTRTINLVNDYIVADMRVTNGNWTFTGGGILGDNSHTATTIEDSQGALFMDSTGTLVFLNDVLFLGGSWVRSGTLQIGDGGETGTIAGDIYNYSSVVFDRSNYVAFEDNISGTGTLTKRGDGTLDLLGNNTYTGLTLIERGRVRFGNMENSLGSMTVQSGSVLSGINTDTELTATGIVNNNGGTIETFGDFSVVGTLRNTQGRIQDITGTLSATTLENNGGVITDVENIDVSGTLRNDSEIANAPSFIYNIAGTLSAGAVENKGGVMHDINTMVVAGELSNLTPDGTLYNIRDLQAGSVRNEGVMTDIGTMTVVENLTSSGFIGNIDTFNVLGNAFNAGVVFNIKSFNIGDPDADASVFVNQYGGIFGGINRINMNGGTFHNQGGVMIIGQADADASGEPFFTKIDTMKIDGDFVSEGGLFVIGLDDRSTGAQTHSVIEVTGTATINGGFVNIIVERDQHYVATDSTYRYVFLKAEGGLEVDRRLEDGRAVSVSDPLLEAVLRHDDSQYWFFLQRRFLYSGEGETQNQRALGRYVDVVGIYPGADWRNVLMALDHARAGFANPFAVDEPIVEPESEEAEEEFAAFSTFSTSAASTNSVVASSAPTPTAFIGRGDPIPGALDQMSGSIYGTMTTATFQNTVMFHATLTNVLRRDYNDVGGVYDQIYRGQQVVQRPQRPIYGNRGIYKPTNNVWGMIYGHSGTMHADGNVGKYGQGFFGLMAGFDRINERRARMGVFLSLGEGSLSGQLQDRAISKEFLAGHYYRWDGDQGYFLVQAGLGVNRYDTKRRIAFGGYNPVTDEYYYVDRTAKNNHNAFLATAHVETGLRYRGGILNLSPFVAGQYTGLIRESFTERGADSLNLTASSQTYNSFRIMFGMRFDTEAIRYRRGLASFYGNVAWMYEFEPSGKLSQFTARFSDAGLLSGTPQFTVLGNSPGRDWVQGGFGVKQDVHAHLRLFIGYDAYANMNQVMHSGNLGFVWEL